MKVSIKVTPLIALEPFDMEFNDQTTLGDIQRLIEQQVKNAVREYLKSLPGSVLLEHTVKWHESNFRWVSDNEPQEHLFTPREVGK